MSKCQNATCPENQCSFVDRNGHRCDRKKLAKDLCWTHYQQLRRGRPLTPIRARGLELLPGNVRVPPEVAEVLKVRVAMGLAQSVYEAMRQAIEAGVARWTEEAEEGTQPPKACRG